MSYRAYHPKRGDLVHMNFSPSAGREMADRHYGLVLTPVSYQRKTGTAIVCAITSRVRGALSKWRCRRAFCRSNVV